MANVKGNSEKNRFGWPAIYHIVTNTAQHASIPYLALKKYPSLFASSYADNVGEVLKRVEKMGAQKKKWLDFSTKPFFFFLE